MKCVSYFMDIFNRLLKLEENEQRVTKIKDRVQFKVDEVTETMRQQGVLQRKVLKKTTTYYLAKVSGGIK